MVLSLAGETPDLFRSYKNRKYNYHIVIELAPTKPVTGGWRINTETRLCISAGAAI